MAILPLIVLFAVFVLIAIRQIGGMRLQIWQIMLGCAICVLATGQISIKDALKAIDIDVIVFLFSMFVIGVALGERGYLGALSYKIFTRGKTLMSCFFLLFLSWASPLHFL